MSPGVPVDKVFRVLAKTEKAETFRQFHDSTGLSLLRGAPFAHLFFCADNLSGRLFRID